MKILIISDTHRKHENLLKVLERECPVDLLIHLGDAEMCIRDRYEVYTVIGGANAMQEQLRR